MRSTTTSEPSDFSPAITDRCERSLQRATANRGGRGKDITSSLGGEVPPSEGSRRNGPSAPLVVLVRADFAVGYHPNRMWFIELIQDFWFFLKERKAWWLTPIVAVLLLLTLLIVVSEKAAVLPFIYTLF